MGMEKVLIADLDFGKADGKKESRKMNFESLFYDGDGYYQRLCEDDVYLVIGRKGTGKSLLTRYFKKVKEKTSFNYCEIIETNKFMRKKLKTFNYEEIQNQEMTTFWRYVFLTEFGRMINSKNTYLLYDMSTMEEKNFTTVSIKEEDVEELNGKISAGLSALNASISSTEGKKVTKELTPEPYYEKIDALAELVFEYMNKTNTSFYLIFDDIDELENMCNSREEFINLAKSFLQALEELNDELYENDTQSKIISTFRTDILDELNEKSNNLNRSMYDSTIKIDWYSSLVKNSPDQTPLIKMLLHKIRNSNIDTLKNYDDSELYTHFFPNDKDGVNNHAEYLLRHSFGRPRDIIIFLQTYQNLYGKEQVFDYSKFDLCKKSYSSWLFAEIKNEINISANREEINLGIEVVKQNQKRKFKFKNFENKYNELKKSYNNIFLSVEDVATELYTLGIVGNVSYRKNNNNRYWFSYRDGSSPKPDFNKDFIVHFGLQNYLSL